MWRCFRFFHRRTGSRCKPAILPAASCCCWRRPSDCRISCFPTTSPLLQAWYVAGKAGAVPYGCLRFSNFGSLLALLSFPLLVEPMAGTRAQAYGWSGILVVFAVLCAALSWRARNHAAGRRAIAGGQGAGLATANAMDRAGGLRIRAAVIRHHASQLERRAYSLLWVATLGVYLLSFILCFERERIYHRAVFLPLLAVALGAAAFALYYGKGNLNIKISIPIFVAALFVCCMACHGRAGPAEARSKHLTSFYLMVALGGALGGLFVAVGAPHYSILMPNCRWRWSRAPGW